MSQDEYEFLIANFSTESFNLHPTREFPLEFPLSDETRQRISIENSSSDCSLRSSDLIGFAGICLDLAHYESMRLKSPRQSADLLSLVMTRGVIANHLSAIQMRPEADSRGEYEYSTHYLNADSSLDYISSMPSWMFGKYCALELENSLKEQSDAIDRLTKNRSESFEQQAA
jgi:hypothetical protein